MNEISKKIKKKTMIQVQHKKNKGLLTDGSLIQPRDVHHCLELLGLLFGNRYG
jgi:hypothetical protein